MQKLVNAMAVTAFLMSGTLTAIAVVAYTKIPQLTTRFMDQGQTEIQSKISEAIAGALPPAVQDAMPELPLETGPAIPSISLPGG